MKKIAWCVPLGFVTAVIFLLGNVSTAQAATVCEWGYISMGGNEYIRQLVCYENGGEGREDVKYGTRPGSNNPHEGGGGGIGDNNAKPDEKLIGELAKKLAGEYKPPCIYPNENGSVYVARAIASCVGYVTDGLQRVYGSISSIVLGPIMLGASDVCRNTVNEAYNITGVATCS